MRNLCLIIMFISPFLSFGQWGILQSGIIDSEAEINDVCFLNDSVGYICGGLSMDDWGEPGQGFINKTIDGGKTWVNISNDYTPFDQIYFTDEMNGYATSYHTHVLKTTDGGNSWVETLSGARVGSYRPGDGFQVLDDGFLIFDGVSDSLLYSTDGGESWNSKYTPFPRNDFYGNNFYFINSLVGFTKADNKLYKTLNRGDSWHEVTSLNGKKLGPIYFVSDSIGYSISGELDYEFIKTLDQGNTWSTINRFNSQSYRPFSSIKGHGNKLIYAGVTVMVSEDSGKTWIEESVPTSQYTRSLHITENFAYAVGFNNFIIKRDLSKCAFFSGKVKLKSRISCANNFATYNVFAKNYKSPLEFNWLSTVNQNFSGDTSEVEFPRGFNDFIVTDADECVDTVSFNVSDLKSLFGVDFEPFYVPGNFRTGFTRSNFVRASNMGCNYSTAKLYVVLDDLVHFVPESDVYDEIYGDTLVWNIGNNNFDTEKIVKTLSLNTDLSAQIGDTVCIEVWIESTINDEVLVNNYKKNCLPVINGYDPNDISVYPSSCPQGYILSDDLLTYKIRFQNTGNAEAININVFDTLSKYLDYGTLKIIGSSHDSIFNTYIHNDSVLQFSFENIWLKDSTTNEPESHGYIIYQIKPKANLSSGTQISNKADIYFDFNPAVVTNTVHSVVMNSIPNCIGKPVSSEKLISKSFLIYPNPSDGKGCFIDFENSGTNKVCILDIGGKVIYSESYNVQKVFLDFSLKPGIYFVEVSEEFGKMEVKRLVVK